MEFHICKSIFHIALFYTQNKMNHYCSHDISGWLKLHLLRDKNCQYAELAAHIWVHRCRPAPFVKSQKVTNLLKN